VLTRSDVVSLQLPGFGVAAPAGWGATKEEYVEWLIGVLEAIGEPVDLVGHDWGGGFVARVACLRPDLIRSWVCDVTGILHPDYVWHTFAQIWQTAGAGEQYFVDSLATPLQDRVNLYVAVGMPPDVAADVAAAGDEEMGRCVLALYRSAAQPAMVVWGNDAEAAAQRSGLTIINTKDHFVGTRAQHEETGRRMGATIEVHEGLGHWWMLEDPARGAVTLERFWATQ
jgi:pimeloyl-ACP methyl ester carboxylesterase